MHPMVGDLSSLKDSEIENKINDLSRKYFMTYNLDLQQQIANVLNTYRSELADRRSQEWKKMNDNRNKDLDKLINVN